MIATGADETINMYSIANDFSLMYTLEGHTQAIRSLSFAPDSNRLVSCGGDKSIRLWNPTAGTLLETVGNAHTNEINTVAHSPSGNLIANCCDDGTIKIWDAKTLNLKFAIDDAHSTAVFDLSFSPTGPFLLSAGSDDKTAKVIKIALLENYERKFAVLLAYIRFTAMVDASTEKEEVKKFDKVGRAYNSKFVTNFLRGSLIGGGPKGVLGAILSFV